jgi:hypothetical protein
MNIEELIVTYGEQYRNLIETALVWLAENEPKWGLETPIDEVEYIKRVVYSAKRNYK